MLQISSVLGILQLCVTKNSFENNPIDSYIVTGGLCLNMELRGAKE